MIYRRIFSDLELHLSEKQMTVVTGMRRTGKTTALKHLLKITGSSNSLYLDLEKAENRYLFKQQSYEEVKISLQIEGADFDKKLFIAIDEIQLVPEITSVLKYFYDTYDIKFLLSGSSSFYIKNRFSESLAGRKQIFEMFPLTFFEFLSFKNIDTEKFPSGFVKFNYTFYTKYKSFYEEYLRFGGFPEIAAIENQTRKISYLKDILNSYIELDIKLLSDFAKADELYKLIRLLSTRVGQKTDFTKLANITGISIYNLKGFMQLLDYTYFIKIVPAFVRSIDREIAQQQKMYFADSGLLTVLGNTDRAALLENTLANALYNYGSVKYYAKKNGQEIDFILNESIAAEVKLTPGIHDKNTLRRRAESIDIQTHYIVGLELPDSEYSDFVWAGTL